MKKQGETFETSHAIYSKGLKLCCSVLLSNSITTPEALCRICDTWQEEGIDFKPRSRQHSRVAAEVKKEEERWGNNK